MKQTTHTGGCLCAHVQYEIRGLLRDVAYCHCLQCRKTSGHYVAATSVAVDDLVLIKSDTLTWYSSSNSAERGFCNRCGGNLFWRPMGESRVSIMAGTIDGKTGLKASEHIFTESAGDYYSIDDGLPGYPTTCEAS